jgi:uncharacterized protein (TIGR02246 family)
MLAMREVVLAVLVTGSVVLPTLRTNGDAATEIQALENRREAALVRKDVRELEKIYAPDYTLITLAGGRRNRQELLDDITSGRLVVQQMQRSQVELHVYGDVAVQLSRDSFQMTDAKTPQTGHKWVTRVYVRESGTWRLAHVQDTLAEQ